MDEDKIPRIGLAVIIERGGEILLGKRKGAHDAGSWSFPGGHLEFGESFEDCARREVDEETGLGLGKVNYFATTNDIFTGEKKHYVTIFMGGEYIGGEPEVKESEFCEEWRWFREDSFPSTRNLMLPIQNLILNNGGRAYLFRR